MKWLLFAIWSLLGAGTISCDDNTPAESCGESCEVTEYDAGDGCEFHSAYQVLIDSIEPIAGYCKDVGTKLDPAILSSIECELIEDTCTTWELLEMAGDKRAEMIELDAGCRETVLEYAAQLGLTEIECAD